MVTRYMTLRVVLGNKHSFLGQGRQKGYINGCKTFHENTLTKKSSEKINLMYQS